MDEPHSLGDHHDQGIERLPSTSAAALPPSFARPWAGKWVALLAVILVIVATVLFVFGLLPKLQNDRALRAKAENEAGAPARVVVVEARRAVTDEERTLPGNAVPLLESSLYARITGYVKERLVDIGDQVKEGQLLALIDAPDTDAQLNQAKANLELARATLKVNEASSALAKIVLRRSQQIRSTDPGAVSQQLMDEQEANVRVTAANVENANAAIKVNEANVDRYTTLRNFEKIAAPFPGVITVRNIDKGDLIIADSQGTGRQLFHLMRTDVLRIFVNVPQSYSTTVRAGQAAFVFRHWDPLRQFQGKVTRTADALDASTRTLLTEVQVANPDNALRPGMYLDVRFVFDRALLPILIPSAALVTRSEGTLAAVVDAKHTVHYRKILLGRDFGANVEVVAGLEDHDQVLIHPGDDLPEGTLVEPIPPPK